MAGIPSVLAFEKKLVASDGYMYSTNWSNRNDFCKPLSIIEKSVRGTISNRLKNPKEDSAKLDAKVEKPNLQTVDNCALGIDHDTLKLTFTLKVLSGVQYPSACSDREFNKSYTEVAGKYIDNYAFKTLSERYALNIANARYLWRNRVGAENIEVQVKVLNKFKDENNTKNEFIFDGSHSCRNFDDIDENVSKLAELIASALSKKTEFLLLEINAFAQVGKAQDVYPSEELVLDKGKGRKSKILYSVDGTAAMHSQKIGNALRTIDTWYPNYSNETGPIAIESYGAVTNLGIAYRQPKDKADFYTLFDKYATGSKLEREDQEHYVMAVLVRGGVFGKSDKE